MLKQHAEYKRHFSNLISSLRLNTFTKIDLYQWINEPFTPPPENESETIRGYVQFTVGTKYVKSYDLMQLCMRFHKNHLGHYWEKEDLPILTHPLYT